MVGYRLFRRLVIYIKIVNQVKKIFTLLFFPIDIGGGESMSPEEKERLAQLEQERLEALR